MRVYRQVTRNRKPTAVTRPQTQVHRGPYAKSPIDVNCVALIVIGRKALPADAIVHYRSAIGVGNPAGETIRAAALEEDLGAARISAQGIVVQQVWRRIENGSIQDAGVVKRLKRQISVGTI